MYPYFIVFGRVAPTFGMFMLLGMGAALGVVALLSKLSAKNPTVEVNFSDTMLAGLMGFAGAVIGGFILRPLMRLPGIIISWELYSTIPVGAFFNYLFGEFVFYGALLGGVVGTFIFCKMFKIQILQTCDMLAPAIATGHAIGRIGCLFAGCCFGIVVRHDHPLAIIYPPVLLHATENAPRLATPIIEAVVLAILSALLVLVFLKTKIKGLTFSLYFILYAVARFIIEFYRGDYIRGIYGIFSTSQYISMGVFIAGVIIMILSIKHSRDTKKER